MFLRSSMFPTAGAAKATKSSVNKFTQASWAAVTIGSATGRGGIAALSGSMTAATLKTLLNISGTGVNLTQLTFRTNDVTSRTIRVKITVDGTVICDSTSTAITTVDNGGCWAGSITFASNPSMAVPAIRSNSTLLVEYASSVTETDKITAEYIYNTEA